MQDVKDFVNNDVVFMLERFKHDLMKELGEKVGFDEVKTILVSYMNKVEGDEIRA